MITCDCIASVIVLCGKIEEDPGFVMQQSIEI